MSVTHESLTSWMLFKLRNDNTRISCFQNVRYKMTGCFIIRTWLSQTLRFYNIRFSNSHMTLWLLIIQIELRSTKSFNKPITDLKCMILYDDMFKNAELAYGERSLITESKEYYDHCWFPCYDDMIFQLILLLNYSIAMGTRILWLLLTDSWNYDIWLLLNLLMLMSSLMSLSRMSSSYTAYQTQLYLIMKASLSWSFERCYANTWISKSGSQWHSILKQMIRQRTQMQLWSSTCACIAHIYKMTERNDSC